MKITCKHLSYDADYSKCRLCYNLSCRECYVQEEYKCKQCISQIIECVRCGRKNLGDHVKGGILNSVDFMVDTSDGRQGCVYCTRKCVYNNCCKNIVIVGEHICGDHNDRCDLCQGEYVTDVCDNSLEDLDDNLSIGEEPERIRSCCVCSRKVCRDCRRNCSHIMGSYSGHFDGLDFHLDDPDIKIDYFEACYPQDCTATFYCSKNLCELCYKGNKFCDEHTP